jgi:hypothetical protein
VVPIGTASAGGHDRIHDLSESAARSVDSATTRRVGDLEDGTMRRTIVVLLGCVAVLAAPASALAGRSESVDPALMQPALNPAYAPWECWTTGTGITCNGEFDESWVNQVWPDAECDGRLIYSTGGQHRTLTRHGDADGRAMWSKAHVEIKDELSMQPDGSGPTMRAVGLFEESFAYSIPGDASTRTDRYTGLDVSITAPGYGLVLRDAGVKTFDIDDNVLLRHGPHPVVDDFDAAMQNVCDAFAALGA